MRGRCTVECLAVDICPLESTVPCRWQGIARPAEQCISNQIVGKGLAAPPLPPAFIIREWPGSESQRRPSGHNARSILQEDRERHRGRTTALTGSIRTARRPISISTALQRAWRILPDASTHRRWFGACAEWGDVLQCSVRPKTRGEPLQYRGVAIAAPPFRLEACSAAHIPLLEPVQPPCRQPRARTTSWSAFSFFSAMGPSITSAVCRGSRSPGDQRCTVSFAQRPSRGQRACLDRI